MTLDKVAALAARIGIGGIIGLSISFGFSVAIVTWRGLPLPKILPVWVPVVAVADSMECLSLRALEGVRGLLRSADTGRDFLLASSVERLTCRFATDTWCWRIRSRRLSMSV